MQYLQTSSHLAVALDPQKRKYTINWCVDMLRPHKDKFDAIAICGSSGMLIGATVADKLDKNIILVRKKNEGSHSSLQVEGPRDGRYLVVDDLLSSGDTLKRIVKQIHKKLCQDAKFIGALLYLHQELLWINNYDKSGYGCGIMTSIKRTMKRF